MYFLLKAREEPWYQSENGEKKKKPECGVFLVCFFSFFFVPLTSFALNGYLLLSSKTCQREKKKSHVKTEL